MSAEKPCVVHWRGTAQKLVHWAAGAERTFWHCSISGADWWLQVSRAPPLLPSPLSPLFLTSPLYPWLASIPLWLTGDPHLQKTYRAWQEPNHHHCVIVCAQYSKAKPLMLSIHTCTHTQRGFTPAHLSVLLCRSKLHTAMLEWVCISGQIGIYKRTKCVCVCVEVGVTSRLVSSSNNPLLWVSSSPHTGPQSGAKARKFSPDCFWSPKIYPGQFLSSHFISLFHQLILSVDFGRR